ncbi:MAG: hypothetical protein AABX31_03540 [Nanoarchaeota archaeon]
MPTPLSDEKMYSSIEKVVAIISQQVPVKNVSAYFPDKEIVEELQGEGYTIKTSSAFLKACYWYLWGQGILEVDPSNHRCLTERITEDRKTDLCMEIFREYEIFLKANYERSLTHPDPYLMPEKATDSSPGFLGFSRFSNGK